jgi:hypothetical protein
MGISLLWRMSSAKASPHRETDVLFWHSFAKVSSEKRTATTGRPVIFIDLHEFA